MSVSHIWGYLRDPRTWAIIGALAFVIAVMLWNPSHDEPSKAAAGNPTAAVPTAVSTAPPVTTKPVLPQSARNPSDQAAEAFARYAMEVYTYTYATLDMSLMSKLCLPTSEWCQIVENKVKLAETSDYSYQEGRTNVENVELLRRNPAQVTAILHLQQEELRIFQSGTVLHTQQAHSGKARMMLLWQGKEKTWKVMAVKKEKG